MDFLRTIAPIVAVAAIMLGATRRRIVRQFERAHAFSSETAIAPPASRQPFDAWWRTRLTRAGVLRHSPDGRQWLDEGAWKEYRNVRRRRALMLVVPLLLLMAALIVFGTGQR